MTSILHIIKTLDAFGGTPQKLLMQTSGGSRFKHLVFCTGDRGPLAPDFEKAGVRVYGGSRPLIRLPHVLLELVRIVAENDVRVIHAHFFRSRVLAYVLRMITQAAIVVSEHGSVPEKRLHVRFIDALFLSRSVPVVCNSLATEKQFLSDRWGRGATHVIYNGVSIPAVSIAAVPVPVTNVVRLVAVGGLTAWRHYDVLLQGIRKALDRGLELSLAVFGDGPMRDQIAQEVARLALQGTVQLHGYAPRSEVLVAVASSDAYVSAATQEGFGIAAVEAMLLGRAVLLARAGAHAELLSRADDPQYFRANDVDSLVQGLARISADASLRNSLGVENRRLATQRFGVSRFVGELDDLYDALIARLGSRGVSDLQ
mgnify:CR=1 FL=1